MKTIFITLLPLVILAGYIKKEKPEQTKYICTCSVYLEDVHLYTTSDTLSNVSHNKALANCNEQKKHQENLLKIEDYSRTANCILN